MIYLTKTNKERTRFVLNHRLIERMEQVNNTIIYLHDGKKYIVDESVEEIIEKIMKFESKIVFYSTNKEDE